MYSELLTATLRARSAAVEVDAVPDSGVVEYRRCVMVQTHNPFDQEEMRMRQPSWVPGLAFSVVGQALAAVEPEEELVWVASCRRCRQIMTVLALQLGKSYCGWQT